MNRIELGLWGADFVIGGIAYWWGGPVAAVVSIVLGAALIIRAFHMSDPDVPEVESIFGGDIPGVDVIEGRGDAASRLDAKFLHIRFLPRLDTMPMSMLDGVMKLVGRESYKIDCDVLAEVYLVNTTDTPLTIQGFRAQVKIGDTEYRVKEVRSLADWQLMVETKDSHLGYTTLKAEYRDLASLMANIANNPLTKGIGYRGWLRFELLQTDRKLAENVGFSLDIIDSLGGVSSVSSGGNQQELEGDIVYVKGLRH